MTRTFFFEWHRFQPITHHSAFVMIRRPIEIDGILKEAGPGGFGGGTDGGDGQRIAILAGGVEEGITRRNLKKRPGARI